MIIGCPGGTGAGDIAAGDTVVLAAGDVAAVGAAVLDAGAVAGEVVALVTAVVVVEGMDGSATSTGS